MPLVFFLKIVIAKNHSGGQGAFYLPEEFLHGQTLFLREIVQTKIERLCEQNSWPFLENTFLNRILKIKSIGQLWSFSMMMSAAMSHDKAAIFSWQRKIHIHIFNKWRRKKPHPCWIHIFPSDPLWLLSTVNIESKIRMKGVLHQN